MHAKGDIFVSAIDHQQAYRHTDNDKKCGQFAAVHEDGLGEYFAEDHIEHGAAGEGKAQGEADRPYICLLYTSRCV